MIRLVATDLDGTLLRRDGTISPRTVDVLRRITAGGTPVALVTGRPLRWLNRVYAQLPVRLPAVCANGAVIYDPEGDAVLHAATLQPELLAEVCRRLRAAAPGVAFAVEVDHGRQMRHEDTYPMHWEIERPHDVAVLTGSDGLYAQPAVKLLARLDGQDPDAFTSLVTAQLAGIAEATHSSFSGLVEISAAGVTKAAGLAWLCGRHGIAASEVLAFGDMPNDVPMLTWAGRSVAVANAHPAVKEVVDEVTGANDEDGVAGYLDRALPPA